MEDAINDTSQRKRRLRTYNDSYAGPFLIIAESTTGNIIATKIAKWLIKKFGQDYVRAIPMSKTKLKILMGSRDAANKLVKKNYDSLRFSIPQRLVECLGVAYIEPEVESAELETAKAFDKKKLVQDGNPSIVEVRRITKKGDDGVTVSLYTVIFTFDGLALPSHVEINKVLYAVKPYVYPIRQCGKCWRLGHDKKSCKSAIRCNNCLEGDRDADHTCVQQAPQCVNCNGPHKANDKRCPKIIQEKRKDEQRQATYSQGKTDWFCVPVQEKSSTDGNQSNVQNSSQKEDNSQSAPSSSSTNQIATQNHPQKRRVTDTDWNEELPQLEVNISEGVCNSIQSSIASNEVADILGKVLEVATDDTDSRDKIHNLVLSKIYSVVEGNVRDYLSTLRL